MKIKTSELTGAALDWAVAIAEGFKPKQLRYEKWCDNIFTCTFDDDGNVDGYITGAAHLYSRKWVAGGPIIEREGIRITNVARGVWGAVYSCGDVGREHFAETPLIAAMRCYVASKLGNEVGVPKELIA